MNRRILYPLLFLFFSFSLFSQFVPRNRYAEKRGRFRMTFPRQSPFSSSDVMESRFGWEDVEDEWLKLEAMPYTVTRESYVAYVPADYDSTEAYGLLVWTSPSPYGGPPESWEEVLDRYRLIWIGANHVQNDRALTIRLGLALDAAFNMTQWYRIDSTRIYAGGFSGGGRISSELALVWSDVFSGGGLYIMGCNFIHDQPDESGLHHWTGFWPRPDSLLLNRAQSHRFVFLTGDNDFNLPGTRLVHGLYPQQGLKLASYLQVPDLGHRLPSAEWFDQAVKMLDRPLKAPKPALLPLRLPGGQVIEAGGKRLKDLVINQPKMEDSLAAWVVQNRKRALALAQRHPVAGLEILMILREALKGMPLAKTVNQAQSRFQGDGLETCVKWRREIRALYRKVNESGSDEPIEKKFQKWQEKLNALSRRDLSPEIRAGVDETLIWITGESH